MQMLQYLETIIIIPLIRRSDETEKLDIHLSYWCYFQLSCNTFLIEYKNYVSFDFKTMVFFWCRMLILIPFKLLLGTWNLFLKIKINRKQQSQKRFLEWIKSFHLFFILAIIVDINNYDSTKMMLFHHRQVTLKMSFLVKTKTKMLALSLIREWSRMWLRKNNSATEKCWPLM